MRTEIHEAESSTSAKPLWLWRVWCNGAMAQGFSPTEQDAAAQAKLEQARLGQRWGSNFRASR